MKVRDDRRYKDVLAFTNQDFQADEEIISEALQDRLAFSVSIENLHYSQTKNLLFDLAKIQLAQDALPSILIDTNVIKKLTEVCVKLGIESLRAPILASYAARASAAFSNNQKIMDQDIYYYLFHLFHIYFLLRDFHLKD